MSQENVDAVRQMNEGFLAFQNGDPSALTAALAVLDPEIEWHGTVGGLDENQVAHGYEELAQAFAENFEAWEKLVLETERYIDAGDHVVVFWHEVARSRHSEQEMETTTAVTYRVRDGRIVEARGYMNRTEALEAVGLSEQDTHAGT
jgi:ketosteroid isomerase-like protein